MFGKVFNDNISTRQGDLEKSMNKLKGDLEKIREGTVKTLDLINL